MAKNDNGFTLFAVIAILLALGAIAFIKWPQIKAIATGTPVPDSGSTPGTTANNGGSGSVSGSGSNSGNGGISTSTAWDLNKSLYNGSRGSEVMELQRILNAADVNNPLVLDGIFGVKTQSKLYAVMGVYQTTLGAVKAEYSYL